MGKHDISLSTNTASMVTGSRDGAVSPRFLGGRGFKKRVPPPGGYGANTIGGTQEPERPAPKSQAGRRRPPGLELWSPPASQALPEPSPRNCSPHPRQVRPKRMIPGESGGGNVTIDTLIRHEAGRAGVDDPRLFGSRGRSRSVSPAVVPGTAGGPNPCDRLTDVSMRRGRNRALGVSLDPSLTVTSVEKGSAAEAAGLRAGQVLTGVNGEHVSNQDAALAALSRAGDEVRMSLRGPAASPRARGRKAVTGFPASYAHQALSTEDPEPVGLRHIGPPGWGPTAPQPASPTPLRYERTATAPPTAGAPTVCSAVPRLGLRDNSFEPRFRPPPSPAHSPRHRNNQGRWNKTSYELALDGVKGSVHDDRLWKHPVDRRHIRRVETYRPDIGKDLMHHNVPENDSAARAAVWRMHSPRRGPRPPPPTSPRLRMPANGPVPDDGAQHTERPGRRQESARREYKASLLHHDENVTDNDFMRTRSWRAQTPGCKARRPWQSHGDITGGRYHDPSNPDAPPQESLSPRGRRSHQRDFFFDPPQIKRRSFTPTARFQRPVPSSTDIFHRAEPVPGACQDLRTMSHSGKRTAANGGPSPRHNSQGVGSCLSG